MVTQNHFVIPATVLEKFRSRGFPEGVTLTADHCIDLAALGIHLATYGYTWSPVTVKFHFPTILQKGASNKSFSYLNIAC